MVGNYNIPDMNRQGRKRRMAAVAVGLLALIGWSAAGTQVIGSLNPMLKHELALAMHPALDVWITQPDYTSVTPTIISTPAGVRFQNDTLTVPQGSTVSAHLAEQDGDVPELVVDGDSKTFAPDAHGDFAATQVLTEGRRLSIRRGWLTLATWHIHVIADAPPKVALVDPPAITEGKAVRLSYTASDAWNVAEVALRVTPHNPLPGANAKPVDIALPAAPAKQIARVDFQDLTPYPWAGQKVSLQIVASNASGLRSLSAPVDFTLPERNFYNPVARVLIDERKKLLQKPDDAALRDEVATIMAGTARQPGIYHDDPVIMMALRSGAVRLVLNPDRDAAISVNDLLWETATRVEDGSAGTAQRALRDARQDLAQAISRNAGAQELQTLTGLLQQAMSRYVADIATRAIGTKNEMKNKEANMRDSVQPIGKSVPRITPRPATDRLSGSSGL